MAKQTLDLQIDSVAFGALGVARYNQKVVFVEGALVGERVHAEVLKEKDHFIQARALSIETPNPHREQPPCRFYQQCGGCQYQHVSYVEELSYKTQQVRSFFSREMGLAQDYVENIAHGVCDYHYRNSATLHKAHKTKRGYTAGFVGPDNKTVVPISECLLLSSPLNACLSGDLSFQKNSKITIKSAADGRLMSDQTEVYAPMAIGSQTLLCNSKGFFQVNSEVAGYLTQWVREQVIQHKPRTFVDLYCGVGTFALLCAKDIPNIVCVEESVPSLEALRMNSANLGVSQMKIIAGSAEKAFPLLSQELALENAMICVDPPRSGLEGKLAEAFRDERAARWLIYISCNLPSMIRDLKIITSTRDWAIESVKPFDMFPRTKHIECAVLLKRHS